MPRLLRAGGLRRRLADLVTAAALLAPLAASAASLAEVRPEGEGLARAAPAFLWFLPLVVAVSAAWRLGQRRGPGHDGQAGPAAPRRGRLRDALSLFPSGQDR